MLRFALTAAAIVFLAAAPPAARPAPQQPSESPVFRGSVQSSARGVLRELLIDARLAQRIVQFCHHRARSVSSSIRP